MISILKLKKDYYGGAFMVVVGALAAYVSMGYKLGSLARMGPGFFPCAIGCLMVVTGLLMVFSARFETETAIPSIGHKHEVPDLRGSLCLVLGVLAFIGFGHYFGLIPATFSIVFISAMGDRSNSVRQAFLLASGMSLVAVAIFWWALKIQLPLFSWGI